MGAIASVTSAESIFIQPRHLLNQAKRQSGDRFVSSMGDGKLTECSKVREAMSIIACSGHCSNQVGTK
jgi:hypothetical protein